MRLADEMKVKNQVLRSKCCQYLLSILFNYPEPILEKHASVIEDVIMIAINEAAADTRATARECYLQYANILPSKAQELMARLNPSAQKAIIDSVNRKTVSGELPREKMKAKTVATTVSKTPSTSTKDKVKSCIEIPEKGKAVIDPSASKPKKASEKPKVNILKAISKPAVKEESWVSGPQVEELYGEQSGYEEQKADEAGNSSSSEGLEAPPSHSKDLVQLLAHCKSSVTAQNHPL